MRRQNISFEEFKKVYINQPDGFFPVYSRFAENDYSEPQRILCLDLICEWRLDDGKVQFLEVPFANEEQFNEIIAYLKVAADLLNKAILERIDSLNYTDTQD